jgi:hypothetical protein
MTQLMAVRERAAFSARLTEALRGAGFEQINCSALAQEFNSRTPDNYVTVHAVRKWMVGEAIPSQENLIVLARWLAVNPEWLRYGSLSTPVHVDDDFKTADQVLLREFASLDDHSKQLAHAFVSILLKAK